MLLLPITAALGQYQYRTEPPSRTTYHPRTASPNNNQRRQRSGYQSSNRRPGQIRICGRTANGRYECATRQSGLPSTTTPWGRVSVGNQASEPSQQRGRCVPQRFVDRQSAACDALRSTCDRLTEEAVNSGRDNLAELIDRSCGRSEQRCADRVRDYSRNQCQS